jgi:hypothetical protein
VSRAGHRRGASRGRSQSTAPGNGRARSAHNAFRHGLSIPIGHQPELSPQVAGLIEKLVGANASVQIREYARAVAEAQIDLSRIRGARHQFLQRALASDFEPWLVTRQSITRMNKLLASSNPQIRQLMHDYLNALPVPEGFEKLAWILDMQHRALATLDRYERRALSRRTRAIVRLDGARLTGT